MSLRGEGFDTADARCTSRCLASARHLGVERDKMHLRLPGLASRLAMLQQAAGNAAVVQLLASRPAPSPAAALVQRQPSDFSNIVPKDLLPGILAFLNKDPWNAVVAAVKSYATLSPQDVGRRSEQLDALEEKVNGWRRSFNVTATGQGGITTNFSDTDRRRFHSLAELSAKIWKEREELDLARKQRTTDMKSGSGSDITCYRGMSFTHPRFKEALQGIVRPMSTANKGATFDTENTSFTAWDTDSVQPAAIATGSPLIWGIDHLENGTLKYDPAEPVGLVLEVTVKDSNATELNRGEVQLEGELVADRVHVLLPDSDIVAFQEKLENVPGESLSDEARKTLTERSGYSKEKLKEARSWEMIRYRTSSIYDPKQKKEMIKRLESEYGITYSS